MPRRTVLKGPTMQIMMTFYEPASEFAKRNDPSIAEAYWGGWMAYIGAMNAAGVVVSGAGLMPPETATTLRLREGARHVQDGPYAETKEQVGGFFILEVPDLDTALHWAAQSPAAAVGSVELRPVMPPAGNG